MGGRRLMPRGWNHRLCAPGLVLDDPRLPDHFWAKVEPEPSSGCWLWIGPGGAQGYGVFHIDRVGTPAHRVAYEATHGAIPACLVIDHLCRVTACVNPGHLEAVTTFVNFRRGVGRSSAAALARSSCPYGHPYTPENTYTFDGWRHCRKCRAQAEARRRLRIQTVALTPDIAWSAEKRPTMTA